MLEIGLPVPDITLTTMRNAPSHSPITQEAMLSSTPTPRMIPGCTAELARVRDYSPAISAAGGVILRHQSRFPPFPPEIQEKYQLEFTLLSDRTTGCSRPIVRVGRKGQLRKTSIGVIRSNLRVRPVGKARQGVAESLTADHGEEIASFLRGA
jgi:peroxiredoxin